MKFINRSQAKKQTGCSYVGSINSSAKLIKNKKVSNNYTYIIYLAPSDESGHDVCPFSTEECERGCLRQSGRVKIEIHSGNDTIQKARIKKTKLFFENREFFLRWVVAEMESFQAKADRDGYDFSARLNGTSPDNEYRAVRKVMVMRTNSPSTRSFWARLIRCIFSKRCSV